MKKGLLEPLAISYTVLGIVWVMVTPHHNFFKYILVMLCILVYIGAKPLKK